MARQTQTAGPASLPEESTKTERPQPVTQEPKATATAGVIESKKAEPAETLPKWLVTCAGESKVVEAPTANEARAIFNDSRGHWPSPRSVIVEAM